MQECVFYRKYMPYLLFCLHSCPVWKRKILCLCLYIVYYPFFSTWGEALFMSAQNAIIVSLVYYYNKNMMGLILFTPVYATIAYVLCSSLTPIAVIVKLQEFNLLILLISRVSFWLLCFAHQCIFVRMTHFLSKCYWYRNSQSGIFWNKTYLKIVEKFQLNIFRGVYLEQSLRPVGSHCYY